MLQGSHGIDAFRILSGFGLWGTFGVRLLRPSDSEFKVQGSAFLSALLRMGHGGRTALALRLTV